MNVEKPKAAPVVGIILTALAILLIAGTATFAGPCTTHGDDIPSCYWASRAVLGVAAVIAILSIVRIFETDEGERRGLSLAAALLGALVAALPGWLIGLCADASMQCNVLMRPFAFCLGAAIFLVGAIDLTRRLLAIRR